LSNGSRQTSEDRAVIRQRLSRLNCLSVARRRPKRRKTDFGFSSVAERSPK